MSHLNVHHMMHSDKYWTYLESNFTPDAFETFLHGSFFNKAVFVQVENNTC